MSVSEQSASGGSSPIVKSSGSTPPGSRRASLTNRLIGRGRVRGGVSVRRRFRRRKSTVPLAGETAATRGGSALRDFLRDAGVNPYDIRLPFSARQVGIYHEVLLAGSEDIEKRRDLLKIMETHGRGPFGGPPKSSDPDYGDVKVGAHWDISGVNWDIWCLGHLVIGTPCDWDT